MCNNYDFMITNSKTTTTLMTKLHLNILPVRICRISCGIFDSALVTIHSFPIIYTKMVQRERDGEKEREKNNVKHNVVWWTLFCVVAADSHCLWTVIVISDAIEYDSLHWLAALCLFLFWFRCAPNMRPHRIQCDLYRWEKREIVWMAFIVVGVVCVDFFFSGFIIFSGRVLKYARTHVKWENANSKVRKRIHHNENDITDFYKCFAAATYSPNTVHYLMRQHRHRLSSSSVWIGFASLSEHCTCCSNK